MKKALTVLLAAALALCALSGCGAEGVPEVSAPEPEAEHVAEPTPTPEPAATPEPAQEPEYWEDPLAGPAAGGYEFRSEDLGLSFTVPAEISERVGVVRGIEHFDPGGESLTLYYYPEDEDWAYFLASIVAVSPRSAFFDPDNWYQGLMTEQDILAVGEGAVYFSLGKIGGTDITAENPHWEEFSETQLLLAGALADSLSVASPSELPELSPGAVLDAAAALEERAGASMTRAEFALLAYDMLEAGSKGEEYALPYSDVAEDAGAARAIAYLASYGLVSGCSGDEFRPDEAITRAEFAEMAQKLLFDSWPECYGEALAALDADGSHPAYSYLNYAWINGWLTTDAEGSFRPDEPITDAEAARALRALRMQKLTGEGFLPEPGFEVTSWWLSEELVSGGRVLVLGGEGGVFCAYTCLKYTDEGVQTAPAALGSGFEPEGGSARLDLGYMTVKLSRVEKAEAEAVLAALPVLPGEVKLPVASQTTREAALRALGAPLSLSEKGGVERWDYGAAAIEFKADGDALKLLSIDSADARFAPSLRGVRLGDASAANVLAIPRAGERASDGVLLCYGGEEGARAEIHMDAAGGGVGYLLITDEGYELRLELSAEGGALSRVVYTVK